MAARPLRGALMGVAVAKASASCGQQLLSFLGDIGHAAEAAGKAADLVCGLAGAEDLESARVLASHWLQLQAKGNETLKETAEASCKANPGCQDLSGDCCPAPNGMNLACCGFSPPVPGQPDPQYEPSTVVDEEKAYPVKTGAFLGPLHNTVCEQAHLLESEVGTSLTLCADKCLGENGCYVFSWQAGRCTRFGAGCRPVETSGGHLSYVRNLAGIRPHLIPAKAVPSDEVHFFAIGDWGSVGCPGRASMHYVHTGRQPGSQEWQVDHDAQPRVASAMAERAQQVKPAVVLNIGDSFYWGGINHWTRGGRGIHDYMWRQAFEDVYNDPALRVPWLSVLGNHDYGGDGCYSDIEAMMAYTFKDQLVNKRWTMPSQFFSHRLDLASGVSVEFFMLDSNKMDSASGRHGGICKQTLCGGVTKPEAECLQMFNKLWSDQAAWLDQSLAASQAKWKVIVGHHKPDGFYGDLVLSMARKYGVQLIVSGHTHEVSFHQQVRADTPGTALLVVGQGGGAQGNPGCGGASFCGGLQDYSFADISLTANSFRVKVIRYDRRVIYDGAIGVEGAFASAEASSDVAINI